MSSAPSTRGSRTGFGKGKKKTVDSKVNVLGGSSSVVAGKKRASGMDDVKTEDSKPGLNYKNLTVPDLKALIEDRGIEKKGAKLKADLIALLEANDQTPATSNILGSDSKNAPTSSSQATKSEAASNEPKAKKQKKEPKPKPPPYVQPEQFDPIDHNSVAIGEKRLRKYEPFPDKSTALKIWKARTERMFMIDRRKGIDENGSPQETFIIAGSKGSLYTVVFGKSPTCNCIDAKIGNKQRCKHVIYVKIVILKIQGNLAFQFAYLSSELEEIFANAPATQLPLISHDQIEDESIYNGKRKPVEGDCPICVQPFEDNEEIVWCKAACGQNFHEPCMKKWKEHSHGQVKCVYCRTLWQEDSYSSPLSRLIESAPKIGGFKNVSHLPMYQNRDKSQYDN